MSNVDMEFKQKNRCQCLTRTEKKYEKKNRNGTSWPEPGSRYTGRNKYVPSFCPDSTGSWKNRMDAGVRTWYFYKDGVKQTGWQTWDGKNII